MAKLLIVDDEKDLLKALSMIFTGRGHEVTAVSDGIEAERLINAEQYDLVISDIRMLPLDGFQLLKAIRKYHPEIPVIMMTAFATLDIALDTIKTGAFDFVTKPFKMGVLLAAVDHALEYARSASETIDLGILPSDTSHMGDLIANSTSMAKVCRIIEQIAPADTVVLITGEKGSGKKLAADTIHSLGPRRNEQLVVVSCASRSDIEVGSDLFGHIKGAFAGAKSDRAGRIEIASKGTLVLEEIDGLSMDMQEQLMTYMDTKQFSRVGDNHPLIADVRLIATSHVPLEQAVERGTFRKDLFHSLNIFPLKIPPLRERKEDIPGLIHVFAARLSSKMSASLKLKARVMDLMRRYSWPGNAAELENVIREAVAAAKDGIISVKNLPPLLVDHVQQMASSTTPFLSREDLRGQSFREYIRMKEKELTH